MGLVPLSSEVNEAGGCCHAQIESPASFPALLLVASHQRRFVCCQLAAELTLCLTARKSLVSVLSSKSFLTATHRQNYLTVTAMEAYQIVCPCAESSETSKALGTQWHPQGSLADSPNEWRF